MELPSTEKGITGQSRFGKEYQKVHFAHVKFEMPIRHSRRDVN